ncbi:MAG: SMP-30/gluconolactonase/LRE family protein [Proteobacteria bacterium]|nr:SMP-30/gluconolactonase/LRE family protein [Pseudomonadota bacterium]
MRTCAAMLLLSALVAGPAPAADVRVLNDDAHFAEGPIWHHGKLYYVEYDRNTVTTWDGRETSIFWSKPGCGPSAVIATASGEFLVTCYDSNSIGRIAADGRDLPPYTHDRDGHPLIGPNDFAPDRHGGVYFTCSGTLGVHIDGKVFYLAADGTITQVASDVRSANGIVVSLDGQTLYVIETEDHRVIQFRIGADHTLSERAVFVNLDELTHEVAHLFPDGIKLNSKGEFYVGQNPRDPKAPLAGTIFVIDASARLLRTLKLPSPGVPNFAFSPDEGTLYVTALDQLDRPPYRGKVYAIPSR